MKSKWKGSVNPRTRRVIAHILDFSAKNPGMSEKEAEHEMLRFAVASKTRRKSDADMMAAFAVNSAFESDRGFVTAVASIIDKQLESLITEFFKKRANGTSSDIHFLFHGGSQPPLRSTAIKITVAHVLGLITILQRDALTKLQSLRSKQAAHDHGSFILNAARVGGLYDALGEETKNAVNAIVTFSDQLRVLLKGMDLWRAVFYLIAIVLLAEVQRSRRYSDRKRKPLNQKALDQYQKALDQRGRKPAENKKKQQDDFRQITEAIAALVQEAPDSANRSLQMGERTTGSNQGV